MIKRILAAACSCAGGLLLSAPALAQPAPASAACPKVSMFGSDTGAGQPAMFMASVEGGELVSTQPVDEDNGPLANAQTGPTFNWTVSAGSIESGQGGSMVHVTKPAGGDTTITATVEVGGFAPSCRTSASDTIYVNKQ